MENTKTYMISLLGKEIHLEQLPNGKFRKPKELLELDGSYGGSQVKPAVEVIIVAQKPPTEPTQAGQALDNGKDVTWLDDCRIPYADDAEAEKLEKQVRNANPNQKIYGGNSYYDTKTKLDPNRPFNTQGRFPANLLVSDDVLDDGKKYKPGAWNNYKKGPVFYEGDKSEYEEWKKVDAPPATYSRFFSLDAWAERNLPFLVVAKASKKEKNAGCEQLDAKTKNRVNGGGIERDPKWAPIKAKNNHPTVKPVKLMSYLITMTTRPGDLVLDPFAGSGSTGVAAALLNREFILIEMDKNYVEIAEARIKHVRDKYPLLIN